MKSTFGNCLISFLLDLLCLLQSVHFLFAGFYYRGISCQSIAMCGQIGKALTIFTCPAVSKNLSLKQFAASTLRIAQLNILNSWFKSENICLESHSDRQILNISCCTNTCASSTIIYCPFSPTCKVCSKDTQQVYCTVFNS